MRKKGFIDKGLYGLKDILNKTSEEPAESEPIPPTSEPKPLLNKENQIETPNEETVVKTDIPLTPSKTAENSQLEEKPLHKTQKPVKLDKEFRKALQNRKEEYLRTKKHVVQKVSSTLNKLPVQISDLERELKDLTLTEKKIKETIEEIDTINEKDWHNEDFSMQLGDAARTVENARLQHLMLSAKLSKLEEDSNIKLPVANSNSIIPELTSLKFIQLFKLGLGFTLPMIIGSLAAGIIISITIFFVMGGF